MKRKIRPLRQKRPAVIHLRTDTPKQLYSILFEMYARAVDPYIIPAMGEIKLRDLKIPQTCINTVKGHWMFLRKTRKCSRNSWITEALPDTLL